MVLTVDQTRMVFMDVLLWLHFNVGWISNHKKMAYCQDSSLVWLTTDIVYGLTDNSTKAVNQNIRRYPFHVMWDSYSMISEFLEEAS